MKKVQKLSHALFVSLSVSLHVCEPCGPIAIFILGQCSAGVILTAAEEETNENLMAKNAAVHNRLREFERQ